MSQINNVGNNSPIHNVVRQTVYKQTPAEAPAQLPVTDKVELSGVGHLMKSLKANDVRTDKVAEIKLAIEAGTYEDDAKLDAAIDKLLDELA